MKRNGTEVSRVPEWVSQKDLNKALEPLMDLLGTDINRVYALPGITIHTGARRGVITMSLAGHVVTSAAARNVTVGDDDFAEEATEVRVQVRL